MKLPRKSLLVGLAALLIAAVVAVGALIRQSSPFTWDLYVLWVPAPYAALAAALLIPWGDADRRTRSGCVTALVLLAVTHYFYRGGPLFFDLPMYLLTGSALLWALLYWLGPTIWAWLAAETGKLD